MEFTKKILQAAGKERIIKMLSPQVLACCHAARSPGTYERKGLSLLCVSIWQEKSEILP